MDSLDRAAEIFFSLKMDKTDERNATLIYVAMKDHQFAIFGDEGIHQKVGTEYWKRLAGELTQSFNRENYAEGISNCVIQIGMALQKYFPYNKDTDKNELPDTIVFGRQIGMKRTLLFIGLLISFCVSAQIEKYIPAKPSPPRLVNDFTGNFLTPEQREALERKLKAYDDSTSSQIAIVIVESLEGYEANEYATELGKKWGVGGKEFNNGVVILVSTGGAAGTRDAYIATGYGLEGAIPDITAKFITLHELIANFKQEQYYRGLDEATNALIKAAAGEYKAPENYRSKNKGINIKTILLILFILFILFAGRGGGGTSVSRGERESGELF